MGIEIGITVSSHIPAQKWEAVYQEAYCLAQKLGLATCEEKEIHGHVVRCLVPTHECDSYGRQGWWAVADYEYGDDCEGFFFPKKLRPPVTEERADILSLRAHMIDCIDLKNPSEEYERIWGNKTQGHYYHYSLLAIGCLVQDRLGDDAYVHGSINAGQCKMAVKMANEHLDIPIQMPYQCDASRWMERVGRLDLDETDKVRIAIGLYLGKKDAGFGELLRNAFSRRSLTEFWRSEFTRLSMNAMGFRPILKAYLTMGFLVEELGRIVPITDENGKDQRENLIRMVMDAKCHWKEKNCSDIMEEDPDDPRLYDLEAMLVRELGMGLRNKTVDRYIPIDELRRLLREGFEGFDVDGVIDGCLQTESDDSDQENELIQFMRQRETDLKEEAERYEIYAEDQLQFYKPGLRIKPQIEKNLQFLLTNSLKMVREQDFYKQAVVLSVMKQGTFLIGASEYFSVLRDRDWEKILSNLEKDIHSFDRYVSLFSLQIKDERIKKMTYALVVNDDLYAYISNLPYNDIS